MLKICTTAIMVVALGTAAVAQTPTTGRSVSGGTRDRPLNSDNLSATGKTMPSPGVSQGSGTTSLDVGVERKDQEIQNSICRNC